VWAASSVFQKGRFLWKLPRRLPYPVTINYGRPLPHTATPFEVRSAVQELLVEAWKHRQARMRPLPIAFVHAARQHPFRFAMADAQHAPVTFGSALVRAIFLARRLRKNLGGPENGRAAAAAIRAGCARQSRGAAAGQGAGESQLYCVGETLAACIRQCDIKTVVTSKSFLEKVKLTVPCETVMLEDVAATPGFGENWPPPSSPGWCRIVGCSEFWARRKKTGLDDLATVIFSSAARAIPRA